MMKFSVKTPFTYLSIAVAITVLVTWLTCLYQFERPVFSGRVEFKNIASNVLKESRDYIVHLPENFQSNSTHRYPVIYALDGSSQDIHTAESAALMARIGVMPEVIVVGIPNVNGKSRQRDYTPPFMRQDLDEADNSMGKADAFLEFLQHELIPEIESKYPTSNTRILTGNSRGGLFVMYALISQPNVFSAHIANSPALWRDDGLMIDHLKNFLMKNTSLDTLLFLSLGNLENAKMTEAFNASVNTLDKFAPKSMIWKSYSAIGVGHNLNAKHSTPVALYWLFRDKRLSNYKDECKDFCGAFPAPNVNLAF